MVEKPQIIADIDGDQFEFFAIPDINKFTGGIPAKRNFVVYEEGTSPIMDGFVLYGFDEVESVPKAFGIKKPTYCFISAETIQA